MDKTQNRERGHERLDPIRIGKYLLSKAVYILSGFCLGAAALPFGAYPFGIALISVADGRAPFVYAGLALSCLFAHEGSVAALFFGVYTALLLLRVLVRLTLDNPFSKSMSKPSPKELLGALFLERPTYRIIISTLCALSLGACMVIGGGFLYYDLFGLLISVPLAPLAAYIFGGFFYRSGLRRDIGALAICAACVWGASPLKLYGVSLALLGALLITFIVTEKKGLGYGSVTGLVLGMVYSPILSPIFVVSALCVGIFMKISPTLACFGAFFASAAWSFYVMGIYALDGVFAAILSSCLLYSVIHKLFANGLTDSKSVVRRCEMLDESELDGIKLFDTNRRMSAISDGLSSLCAFFEEIKLRYPKQAELMRICQEALDSSCSGCQMRDGCKEREHIESAAGRLSFLLTKNRGLSTLDFDRELVNRCTRLPDILDEINYNSRIRMGFDAPAEGRDEIMAPDYKALSRLLEKSMESEDGEYWIDKELSEKLCGAIDSLELEITGAMVYGRRRRNVYIKANDLRMLESKRNEIFDHISSCLPFSADRETLSIRKCSGEGGILLFNEAETLRLDFVSRQTKAKGEVKFCGDSVTMFKNKDNRFFSLISDGMGSGREAAAVSEICTRFIESMLSVGCMNEELLMMLGGLLSGRCEGSLCECSATVDLMEIDLISGKTVFYKSGAAPTYIYRGGSLFKLRSRTLPIGILCDSQAKRLDFSLSSGDVVVMVSDGVTGSDEECPWLFELLRQNIECSDVERTADLIMKYAIGHGSPDDITVAVVKVV